MNKYSEYNQFNEPIGFIGMQWVMDRWDLYGSDKAVLCAIAKHMENSFPGQELLSLESGWSERTVRDAIVRLVASGFLVVENRGKNKSNRYYINWTKPDEVRKALEALKAEADMFKFKVEFEGSEEADTAENEASDASTNETPGGLAPADAVKNPTATSDVQADDAPETTPLAVEHFRSRSGVDPRANPLGAFSETAERACEDDETLSTAQEPNDAVTSETGETTSPEVSSPALGAFKSRPPKDKAAPALSPLSPAKKNDPLFDALARACGMDPYKLTSSAAGALRTAFKQIKDAEGDDLTASLIDEKAETYRLRWKDVMITPPALAKHWPSLTYENRRQIGGHISTNFDDAEMM